MNLLRASRPTHSFNRYTGGIERRHTLVRPPSGYARLYCNQERERQEENETSNEDKVETSETTLEAKNKRIKDLEDSIREAKDTWKMALAEQHNLSTKLKQDITKGRDSGTDKLAKGIFSVGDILDLCLQNKPDLDSEEFQENIHLKGAFDGLQAAKTQLSSVLLNVASITEIVPQPGDNFDPMLHNACFEVDSPSIEAGQIGVVMKSGYTKKDVLFRPADVGIVKYPARVQNVDEDETSESDEDLQQSKQ